MAEFTSIAAAMAAGGFSGSSLGGGATLWTKPTVQNGVSGTLQQTTISGTGQAALNQALGVATPSNEAQMAAAQEQAQALAIKEAQDVNPETARQFEAALLRANPQARQLQAQMTANTQALLRGEIPPDVANLIRQYSAEQNVQGAHAAEARNLGLTSLDLASRGFEQGQALFGIANQYLTAPTVDIPGTSGRIREQLFGAQAITPVQAGSLALQAEQLRVEQSLQNAQLDWAKQLSQMELAREREKDRINAELLRKAEEARAAEQGAKLRAFKSRVSGITSGQQSNEAYLARQRAQVGPTRYLRPGQAAAGYGYTLASTSRFF